MKKLVLGACLSALGLACSPNHNEAERWEEAALQPPPIGALSCAEYAIHKDKFEWVSGIWDFEGTARATYTYTDRTAEIYVSNDAEEYGPGSYAAPTLTDPTVCHDDGGQGVLRLIGDAPFLNWGGGTGRRLQDEFRPGACGAFPAEGDDPLCPDLNPLIEPETGVTPNWAQTYYQAIMDLREYEGVSFWARRGERGQPGIRINLADVYVDDDISFIMSGYEVEPYCQRAVSCDCSGARRCVMTKESRTYCLTPDEEVRFEADDTAGMRLDLCGQSKCAADSETFMRPDPAFGYANNPDMENRQCQPYYFKSDVQSVYNTPDTKFCYDAENGPFPAENFEKCGDNWMASVHLTTEWKFYRVPFTDFQQQGWAMKSPRLDVANLTMLRFTWGAGRVDHYFDEVRFYRGKR